MIKDLQKRKHFKYNMEIVKFIQLCLNQKYNIINFCNINSQINTKKEVQGTLLFIFSQAKMINIFNLIFMKPQI